MVAVPARTAAASVPSVTATEFTKIVPVSGPSVGTPNGRSDDFVGRFSP